MAEVSAPRGVSPADGSTVRLSDNKPNRTMGSVLFRELLYGPAAAGISARWPVSGQESPGALQRGTQGHSSVPEHRTRRDGNDATDSPADPAPALTLDPLFCQLAMNPGAGPSVQVTPPPVPAAAALPLREDLQNLLIGLARRTAWCGDRRRGSARIELSEGVLAGATLYVHTDQRMVSVELELPPSTPAERWQERIAERLQGRGFSVQVRVG